jgi:hypothetical protein
MFVSKARSIPLKWGPVRGSTLVGLLENFIPGWKIMELANTLAYYEKATITALKVL